MFDDGDLMRRSTLVLRATSPPDAQFSVLDDSGREVGRVVAEQGESRNERLVLYTRQHIPVLVVERREIHGDVTHSYTDGQGQPIDHKGLIRPKQLRQGGLFGRRLTTTLIFRDAKKSEVGSLTQALPPEGDHRLGATFRFTISAEVSGELRLAALGFAISQTERSSRFPALIVKQFSNIGQAWPGSAPEPSTH